MLSTVYINSMFLIKIPRPRDSKMIFLFCLLLNKLSPVTVLPITKSQGFLLIVKSFFQ